MFNKTKKQNKEFIKNYSLDKCFRTHEEEINHLNNKIQQLKTANENLLEYFTSFHKEVMKMKQETIISTRANSEHIKDLEKRIYKKLSKKLSKKELLQKKYSWKMEENKEKKIMTVTSKKVIKTESKNIN